MYSCFRIFDCTVAESVTSWLEVAIEKPGIWIEKMHRKERGGGIWRFVLPFQAGKCREKGCWLLLCQFLDLSCFNPDIKSNFIDNGTVYINASYMCICLYMSIHTVSLGTRVQIYPLELKIQVAVSHPMWALGATPRSSRRAASLTKH